MRTLSKKINICNLYLSLWAIYALHWSNVTIPIIESISNVILGINLLISIWFTIIALKNYHLPSIFRSINILIILFSIYGLYHIFFGPKIYLFGTPVRNGTYLVSFLRSFLPIYTFYVFTVKGYLTPKVLKFWSLIFLLIFIFIFLWTSHQRFLQTSKTEFVNNVGYLFAIIIPSVYYWKRDIIQFLYIGICFAFIIFALKRGAMLIAACVIIMFIFYKFRSSKNIKKFTTTILIGLVSIIGYNFISDRIANSDRFQERIEQTLAGNSSHRDVLAEDCINYYKYKASTLQEIFGSGADSTLVITDNYAHNDWLEMLICQGAVGLLAYAYFWFSFFGQWRKTKYSISRQILGSYFIIYFIRSLISMSYSMILSIASMNIGYALAADQLNHPKNKSHQ